MTASNLTYTTTATGYTILLGGKPWIVQDGDHPYFPYAGDTMEDKAKAHIAAILADQQAAQEAASQPSQTDILGQQIAALTLSNAQKDAQISQLGQQVAALTLNAAKGGTAS